MNVQTKRWARPLALFIALTMVMMYSFGGVVFADINDTKVHYHGPSDTGVVIVETTIQYTSDSSVHVYTAKAEKHKGSPTYNGEFDKKIPLSNSDRPVMTNDVMTVNTVVYTTIGGVYRQLVLGGDSAFGSDSANIFVSAPADVPIYDLQLTKIVDNEEVPLGELVEFTITVKNIGTDKVSGVTVTDQIPEGISVTAITQSVGTFDNGVWTIGELNVNESVNLKVEGIVTELDTITNTATVTFSGIDVNEDNNTDDATVDVVAPYDLTLQKTVSPGSVGVSEEAIFTITIKNNGFYEATNVVVEDQWPDGLEFIAATSSDAIQFNAEEMTWTLGSLAPGATKTITLSGISAVVDEYVNTASVTFSGIDQNPNDNSDTATLKVLLERDLGITKIAAPSSILLNGSTVFTVTITNNGTETINNIFVEDVMEAGLSISAIGSDDFEDGIWDVGTLESGASKVLTIAAIGTTVGSLENQVEIVTLGDGDNEVMEYVPFEDENPANNSAKATVTVTNPTNNEEDDDDDTPSGGGDGGGGGSTTTTIPDPEPPLTNIPEEEVPQVEAPDATLEDQPIPLADVPQTGDNTNIWLLLALMMGSGAGIVLLGRRKETVEK